MRWIDPLEAPTAIRGIALLTHGLNLNPDRMLPLADALRTQGIRPLQVILSGHAKDLAAYRRVTRELWLSELKNAYLTAKDASLRTGVPLFFLGYSLGALLGQDLLNSDPEVTWDRQVLLAPATSLRFYAHAVRLFGLLKNSRLIPSLSYGRYHAQPGTTVAAYRALFESIDKVHSQEFAKSKIPTLVIADPRDELVSLRRVHEQISAFRLDTWRVRPIKTQSELPVPYRHLLLDELTVGKKIWPELQEEIFAHFLGGVTVSNGEQNAGKRT